MVLLTALMMFAGLSHCLSSTCINEELPPVLIMLGRIAKVGIPAGFMTTTVLAVWSRAVRPPLGGLFTLFVW